MYLHEGILQNIAVSCVDVFRQKLGLFFSMLGPIPEITDGLLVVVNAIHHGDTKKCQEKDGGLHLDHKSVYEVQRHHTMEIGVMGEMVSFQQ